MTKTVQEFAELHKAAVLAITGDKSLVGVGTPDQRGDQLVGALRHVLCCSVLEELTEAQLLGLTAELEKIASGKVQKPGDWKRD